MKPRRKRRQFTEEFKAEVVRLVRQEGKAVAAVARELDLTESAVGRWVQQAKIEVGEGPPGALTRAEREELGRLRRENRQLQMEREILKKCMVRPLLSSGISITGEPSAPMYSASLWGMVVPRAMMECARARPQKPHGLGGRFFYQVLGHAA
jgi:transposase